MRRVNGTKMPATSKLGSESRTDLWSVVHRKVAKDWKKKSSPPVASSWLTGALPRMGVMISRCTPTPSRAPSATRPAPPSHTGQP